MKSVQTNKIDYKIGEGKKSLFVSRWIGKV